MESNLEILEKRNCVLLLVDIQKSMLDLCIEPERIRKNSAALVEAAGVFGIPVVFSVHNQGKLGPILPELTSAVPGSIPLDKMEFNCFENEQIAGAIMDTGRRCLLIAGIETHVCIFHTAIGALRKGYRVCVPADSVSSRGATDKLIGLQRLDRAGAVISSTEMIIFELLGRAGTDEFRALLPLLKTLPA
ncbi:MAG: isochorismatase family protein [Syntrophobacteraceae bacterium]